MTKTSSRIQAKWQKQIEAQRTSGLSQVTYCKQQGISSSSFSNWEQKLKSSTAKSKVAAVIPVIVPKEAIHVNAWRFSSESWRDLIPSAPLAKIKRG